MNRNEDCGLLLLRLGYGILFLVAGFGKLTGYGGPGLDGFAGMVWGMWWLALLVALGEFLGGLALLVGRFTDYAGYGLAVIMLGAIYVVWTQGNTMGALQNVAHLGAMLGLAMTGPGDKTL